MWGPTTYTPEGIAARAATAAARSAPGTPVRVYLDVDGVFNTFSRVQTPAWAEQASGVALGYPINWHPEMVAALAALEGVEFVWHTSWMGNAKTELAPLIGFGHDFRVRGYLPEDAWMYQRVASIRWKYNALVFEQESSPSPFVWLEDELGPKDEALAAELGGLEIRTEPEYGITPEHIEYIKQYVSDVQKAWTAS